MAVVVLGGETIEGDEQLTEEKPGEPELLNAE